MSNQPITAIAPTPQHWRTDLPLPPSSLTFRPSKQDVYDNSYNIVNRHLTLHALIDATYPTNRCCTCNTTFSKRSEADLHFQTHLHHKGHYLCLYPHCDQVFRSRGVLRFHIASCHVVVNEKVLESDPLYLLYAPCESISNSLEGDTVRKKRKYERRRKEWHPMGKSSVPGQTNFALPPPPIKRRGRPPKNKTMMDTPNDNTIIHDHPPSISVFTLTDQPQQPKVFRLVQQVIPPPTTTITKGRANLSLLSKTLLAEKYNPLRCPSCHLGFKRKTNVVKHLTSVHHGEECFQCVYADCDHPKRFSTREGLVYHILRMHDNDDRPYDASSSDTSEPIGLDSSEETASVDDHH
ncbi:hypothetical protein BC941DRAFT_430307 [Chlamydoabsidia padenii]|nr:hypothetical protein BC941DRAFT_430307 [Chlamydoabsidia padenii]